MTRILFQTVLARTAHNTQKTLWSVSIGYVYHLNNNGIRSAVCRINDDADLNPSELNLNFNLGHLWEQVSSLLIFFDALQRRSCRGRRCGDADSLMRSVQRRRRVLKPRALAPINPEHAAVGWPGDYFTAKQWSFHPSDLRLDRCSSEISLSCSCCCLRVTAASADCKTTRCWITS